MRTQSEPTIHNNEHGNEIMVMILYDDLAAGRWAREVFSSVGKSSPDDLHFRLQPWRLDFLNDPDWAKVAAVEAAEAELLVLSMSHPCGLDARVEKWLRTWLDEKRGAPAALVVLTDESNEKYLDEACPLDSLKEAAREAHVNFFSVLPPDHEPSECFTPAPAEALSYRSPYRHGGLNE